MTLDGCGDHREGIADDEQHAYFTRLMDDCGAMLWGRVTYEMMESDWPVVAAATRTRRRRCASGRSSWRPSRSTWCRRRGRDFPWTNSHLIAGDLRTGVQKLKDTTPAGVLLGSGKLATELDRLDLIDEYQFLVHPDRRPRPDPVPSGLPSTRRLELVSAKPLAAARSPCTTGARAD